MILLLLPRLFCPPFKSVLEDLGVLKQHWRDKWVVGERGTL